MLKERTNVALFVTCLVDLFRPSVGFAAVKLLEQKNCVVSVPGAQTCCGQPAYNSGDRKDARALARRTIRALRGYDYVVVPSGSCAGMITRHYPALFDDQPAMREQAVELAGRTWELITFLTDVLGIRQIALRYDGVVTYHDSCSALREMGIKEAPRTLVKSMSGVRLQELSSPEVCCGFGGTFCVKYPDISNHMVGEKTADIRASKADMVVSGDLGCLLNIAGRMKRDGHRTKVFHVAELIAGMAKGPGIGGLEG